MIEHEGYFYSDKYFDDKYEYRHVVAKSEYNIRRCKSAITLPESPGVSKLLTEEEWRNIGIQQSEGWEHFMVHRPEKNVLLFRRRLNK